MCQQEIERKDRAYGTHVPGNLPNSAPFLSCQGVINQHRPNQNPELTPGSRAIISGPNTDNGRKQKKDNETIEGGARKGEFACCQSDKTRKQGNK